MKNIFVYAILIFCSNVLAHDQLPEGYRYNPFQFKLLEHNFKAEPLQIDSISQLPPNYKEVDFHGYKFFVPESYILQTEKGIPNTLAVRDQNKKGLLMATKSSVGLICNARSAEIKKDYCSAFDSNRDYMVKVYTLTPKDLAKPEYVNIGYSWLVFYKGSIFEDTSDIKMYQRDDFIFFRQNIKPNTPLGNTQVRFMISSPKDDELLSLVFVVNDEKLIMDVIQSFQLITKP